MSVLTSIMASTAVLIAFSLMINYLALAEKREYKLGLLIPYSTVVPHFSDDFNKGENFAAAMTIAVERLNADPTLLADYNVTFVWEDTKCNELIAVREQLNQINSGVQAFIGPGCNCHTAARSAAAFNISMISFMCSSADLSDKAKYPTFARTFVVDSQVGPSVISLLKYTYNWTRVAIIYQDSTQWKSLKEHLVKEFEKNGIDVANEYMVVREAFYFFLEQEAEFRAALRKIKEKARIVLVIASYDYALETLYLAKGEGMINGEFAFVIFNLDQLKVTLANKLNFWWFYNTLLAHERNGTMTRTVIQEAMPAALILAVKNPRGKNYQNFIAEVRTKTSESPFNSQHYNRSSYSKMMPPVYAANLYNAVYQYGVALNKTLAKYGAAARNKTPSGEEILSQLRDYTFDGIQGYRVHLDENGDAQFNLTLMDIRKDKLVEVADFQITYSTSGNQTKKGVPRLVFRKNRTKIWVGGSTVAPKDRPRCGFENELCPPPTEKPS